MSSPNLRRASALGWHCRVRVCQDRVIERPPGEKAQLLSWARAPLVPKAPKRVWLRARAGLAKRQIEVHSGWSEVRSCAPRLGPERGQEPIRGWRIRCWQEKAEAEPIQWILFSPGEVPEAAHASEQVQWYASRWVIHARNRQA